MSKYFLEAETYRISFPDGEWVDVKEEFTQEDQDYILNKMAKAEALGKEAKVEMSLGRMAILERSIVKWSFDAPVDYAHISSLRQCYRSKVLDEVNRLMEQASSFIVKNA